MPSYALAYRLRIRNASTTGNPNGTADALVVTSVRGGTNPYLLEAPTGDGQSFDPLTGEFVAGAYTVLVADPVTGTDGTGTLRLITTALEDVTLRQQLLSRRAYLELSEDGGGTWSRVLVAGFVTGLKLVDAITWSFAIGDARRIEQNHRIFTWSNVPGPLGISERAVFPGRGCLVGGPIIGGFGPIADRAGWEYVVDANEADPVDAARKYVALSFRSGYVPPLNNRVRVAQPLEVYALTKPLRPFAEEYTGILGFTSPMFVPLNDEITWYPSVTVILTAGVSRWDGTLRLMGGGRLFVHLDVASSVSPPSATTAVRMRIVQSQVSEASPLYVDLHPVDLVTRLYDTVGIAWDAATAASVKAAIGDGLRYALRITASERMGDFLAAAVFGPFGFGIRNGADGEREFYLTRRLGTTAPATTIATADVSGDDIPPAFDLDERTIVTAFRISYRTLARTIGTVGSNTPPPPDGVVEGKVSVIVENADVSVFSTREVEYDLPGMVHDVQSFSPAMAPLIAAITQEGFDRYGRGAIGGETVVLRGTPAAQLSIGDEVNVDLAHLPSRGYRLGESSVPARIMQILQRTELPEGAAFVLRDAGVDQQPVTPAATIAVAASGANARTLAKFTITNAAAINTAAVLTTVVEWATGSSAPSGNGNVYARYAPGTVPTGGIALPPVAPGTTVYVRARTEQPFRRASAWTAWSSHALSALSAPTAVANGTLTAESAEVTWTVAAGGFPLNVYLYQGAAAPGSGTATDWAPYLVTQLPGGSTRTLLRGLTASLAYTVGVAHVDPATGYVTTVATDGFTTTTNTLAAAALQGIAVIPTVEDAAYRIGIALALYPANDQNDIVLQRAPDSSGSPGTWADVIRLPGGTSVHVDLLPSTGSVFWYRARHEVPGMTASAWTAAVSGTPRGVPDTVTRPLLTRPSLDVKVTPDATSYTIVVTHVGVMTYQIDGGSDTAGTGSPQTIEVARNGFLGATIAYVFKCVLNGQTLTNPVNVPAVETNAAASFSIGTQTAVDATDRYFYSWTVSGMPVGTTYNLLYKYTNTAGTLVEEGAVSGATSGDYIQSSGNVGASPRYVMTVNAINAGQVIASLSRTGTFVT